MICSVHMTKRIVSYTCNMFGLLTEIKVSLQVHNSSIVDLYEITLRSETQTEKTLHLMMEAAGSLEMLVHSYQSTRCHMLHDSNLDSHRLENIKP
jgi:hypothetical protein